MTAANLFTDHSSALRSDFLPFADYLDIQFWIHLCGDCIDVRSTLSRDNAGQSGRGDGRDRDAHGNR